MATITEYISGKVTLAFERCGYGTKYGTVAVSGRPDLCQFQCNGCFAASKEYKKPPVVIAEEVAAILKDDIDFSLAEAVKPGFINISLSDDFIVKALNDIIASGNFGIPDFGAGRNIIVDYGGANVAKPLHIGHLRPAILGEALKRLARVCGYNAIGDIHMGDWGMPLGLVIAELSVRHPDWKCFNGSFDPDSDKIPEIDVMDLNEIYPFASKKSKEDEDFKALAHTFTCKLQERDPAVFAVWKEIMRASVADLKKNYGNLGVSFELWYGESDSDVFIPDVLETLEKQGLSRIDDGALVADVAEEKDNAPFPPVIIKKSDGSSNYATTDLATLIQRQKDYKPVGVWYVVDKRQALHFASVFRIAKKAGIVSRDCDLYHLGNGTMNGSDGKPFKTRDGGVMRLETLLDSVKDGAKARMKDGDYDNKDEIAFKIAMAAIKFGDMINQPTKDYIFDIDKFLAFEGKTGTYILYTVTRINSVLKKAAVSDVGKINGIYSDTERDIAVRMLLTAETFKRALDDKALNVIAENAYLTASDFSKFYHDCRIIDEEDGLKRSSLIALCSAVRDYLKMQLDVLGIETVDVM